MCRLLAYHGIPITMDMLLYQPRNSLIKQSYNAKELEEPLNGDGFGVGWYVREIDPTPAVFTSVSPAWSNRNLRLLSPKIRSTCFFAHVRAASMGDTSDANCHPFHYDRWMFMHNGTIEGFPQIKRKIRARLSDARYNWLRGQTDSEHFFALLLDQMLDEQDKPKMGLAEAMGATIRLVESFKKDQQISDPTWLNAAITDGEEVVVSRYVSDPKEDPLTLYYSAGARYECKEGVCEMVRGDPKQKAALVVSEKLTDLTSDWQLVKANHLVIVNKASHVREEPI